MRNDIVFLKRLRWLVVLLAVAAGLFLVLLCEGGVAATPNCSQWVKQHFTHNKKPALASAPHKVYSQHTLDRWRVAHLNETLKQYQLACDSIDTLPADVESFIPQMADDSPVFDTPVNELDSTSQIATLDAQSNELLTDSSDEDSNGEYAYYQLNFFTPPNYLPPTRVPPLTSTPEPSTVLLFMTGVAALVARRRLL